MTSFGDSGCWLVWDLGYYGLLWVTMGYGVWIAIGYYIYYMLPYRVPYRVEDKRVRHKGIRSRG